MATEEVGTTGVGNEEIAFLITVQIHPAFPH